MFNNWQWRAETQLKVISDMLEIDVLILIYDFVPCTICIETTRSILIKFVR